MASKSPPPKTQSEKVTEEKTTTKSEESTTDPPDRPHLLHGTPSQMDTQYVNMLLALDSIPRLHNMLAGFYTWVLLAGFVLFPGTFTSLQNSNVPGGAVGKEVLGAVSHVPLFVIAWLCCGIGAVGMVWLWWRWRRNYIWVLNRIFLPGLLNSLAGIISTLANAFGVQHGTFSRTARVTIAVTSIAAFVCGLLVLVYSLWVLRRVKAKHDREVGIERAGKHGEGRVEQLKARGERKV